MTNEMRKRIWELIDEFAKMPQTALFLTLERVVTGENLVMPEFICTGDPEDVRRLIILLADCMRDKPLEVKRMERPE